ncbi:MAG: hypothetical protein JWP23_3454 [Phenylobacterium sp.]|jgi:hypothetical protein|nr:hypothetical protein [Phenylobacterium sp.]
MKLQLISAAAASAAVALLFAGGAQAALPAQLAPCAVTDITPNAQACLGFFGDQLLSGNPGDTAVQIEALGDLGFTWDGTTVVEDLSGLNSSNPTFTTSLNGITFIGLHFGGGTTSPVPGEDTTAFYRLDAGTDLHTIQLHYGSSSDAKLYSTGGGGVVPEPATWAMMIMGLGGLGAALRQRRREAVLPA